MKNKIQIATGFLAMYILSLPVVLIFHSQEHTAHTVNVVSNDFTDIVAEENSDCQICSFYFDQQLHVQDLFVYELAAFSYYFHQSIVGTINIVPKKQQHLRGPPVA
ncbi:hypothetical protein LV716_02580 [Flagellimonas sp. HMM57]|uniref:hypothetical protein n=1 Tax=unclassified Flagellimonas TaxID=2644544 RepID=UPI0013D58592|nr:MULTISPECIES: hypothetical protein [unclassified Flagellimonas]UII76692.1 hypothetical protein LV716_02580 [Flagellimonas sp. HMM57]